VQPPQVVPQVQAQIPRETEPQLIMVEERPPGVQIETRPPAPPPSNWGSSGIWLLVALAGGGLAYYSLSGKKKGR
jgi:hypothetical protein